MRMVKLYTVDNVRLLKQMNVKAKMYQTCNEI